MLALLVLFGELFRRGEPDATMYEAVVTR